MTGSQFSVLLAQLQALRESIDFLALAMERVATIVEREAGLDLVALETLIALGKEDVDAE